MQGKQLYVHGKTFAFDLWQRWPLPSKYEEKLLLKICRQGNLKTDQKFHATFSKTLIINRIEFDARVVGSTYVSTFMSRLMSQSLKFSFDINSFSSDF